MAALLRIRTEAQANGAAGSAILDDGFVEGAYSAIPWWRGDVLCAPASSSTAWEA
jgi:hypothetical protein